jgi:hypothetical protein
MVARICWGPSANGGVGGEFGALPPFDISEKTLFVSYNAAAEMDAFWHLLADVRSRR